MSVRIRPVHPAVSATWDEGRFFDRWMYVHLLCGLSCGFANVLFHWPTALALAGITALLVAWEFGEAWFKVRSEEHTSELQSH